jgi:hypothetical protein
MTVFLLRARDAGPEHVANQRLLGLARGLERHAGGPSAEEVIRNEVHYSHLYGGRSAFGGTGTTRFRQRVGNPGINHQKRASEALQARE